MKIGLLIKENLGGLIFAIVSVVILDIVAVSSMDYGAGRYVALSLLIIPLVFLVWVIGNIIRKAVHPDIVVANGFFGLLKEKVFWRIGPQFILAVITLAIFSNWAESSAKKSVLKAYASQISDVGYIESDYDDSYIENDYDGNSSVNIQPGNPVYVELTRNIFIDFFANGEEFIETDIERATTHIRRGDKNLRVNGNVTYEQVQKLLSTQPSDGTRGIFLDLSGTTGWAEYYENHVFPNSIKGNYVDFLVLPDEFTELPNYFLNGNFISIYIPPTVTKIGGNSFSSCRELSVIVIPPSVIEMDGTPFDGCYNLTNIFFSRNSKLKTIGKIWHGAFTSFDFPPLLERIDQLEAENIGELVFPETIQKIGRIDSSRGTLNSVTILAKNPPQVQSGSFPKTIKNIYVPADSLKTYENAWFDYEFTFNGQLKPIN
jgi:hypothetical protein